MKQLTSIFVIIAVLIFAACHKPKDPKPWKYRGYYAVYISRPSAPPLNFDSAQKVLSDRIATSEAITNASNRVLWKLKNAPVRDNTRAASIEPMYWKEALPRD